MMAYDKWIYLLKYDFDPPKTGEKVKRKEDIAKKGVTIGISVTNVTGSRRYIRR
jgi:hypothetical protein